MMRPRAQALALLVLAAVAGLAGSGCAKAKPARPAGFIPREMMSRVGGYPFHRAWRDPAVDWSRYTAIAVAPVNTDSLAVTDWWRSFERRRAMAGDVKRLAAYTEEAFLEAFRADPGRRFRVVEPPRSPAPDTLVLELALVEVIPSKVTLNALGYAPFAGAPAKVLRSFSGKSSVAFEARIRDGGTGQIVAMFADREAEPTSLVNVHDLTWYGHAHAIIRNWTAQFVQIATAPPGKAVKDTQPFTLKPW